VPFYFQVDGSALLGNLVTRQPDHSFYYLEREDGTGRLTLTQAGAETLQLRWDKIAYCYYTLEIIGLMLTLRLGAAHAMDRHLPELRNLIIEAALSSGEFSIVSNDPAIFHIHFTIANLRPQSAPSPRSRY
jgi:hypothetical protein